MTSNRWATIAALTAAVVATSCLAFTAPALGASRDRRWIALGDSYSSGEGIPGTSPGKDNYRKDDCARATGVGTDATAWAVGAYEQVRDALGFSSIDFVACTGALADEADQQFAEAQEKSGRASWDLATFSFGGNNIGFPEAIKGCLDVNGWGVFDLTPGCDVTEQQIRDRIDMLVGNKPIGAGYAGSTTLPRLYDEVATRINRGGNVVVVGYPNLVEEVSRWDRWRRNVISNCEGIQSFDVGMLRNAAGYLNQQIALAVQAADVRHRDDGIRFTFEDISRKVYETGDNPDQRHALCTKTPWLNGQTVGISSSDLSRSFHPMQAGHTATSDDLAQVIRYDLNFDTGLPPEPTVTTLPSSGYSTEPFTFKSPAGWQYTYTPNVGSISLTLTKDIQTSPPGKAKLVGSLSSTAGDAFPGEIVGSNPGRTSPTPTFARSWAQWALPDAVGKLLFNPETQTVLDGFAECKPRRDYYTNAYTFDCPLESPDAISVAASLSFTTGDIREVSLDALIEAVSETQPILTFTISENGPFVERIILRPDGSVKGCPGTRIC